MIQLQVELCALRQSFCVRRYSYVQAVFCCGIGKMELYDIIPFRCSAAAVLDQSKLK